MTPSEAEYFRVLVYFEQSTYEQDLAKVLGEKMSLKKWRKTAIYPELNKRISPKSQRWLSTHKSSKASPLSNHQGLNGFEKPNATSQLNGAQKSNANGHEKEKGTPSFSYSIPSSSGENQAMQVTGALSNSDDAATPPAVEREPLTSMADRIRTHLENSDSTAELVSHNKTSFGA